MKFHREGGLSILLATLLALLFIFGSQYLFPELRWVQSIFSVLALSLLVIVLQFFRNPARYTPVNPQHVIAPADGKVVVIEEVDEPEFLKQRCIQVSIFMSPFNVHVNRNPIGGVVEYAKYHAGKYLVAWHPKSSTENERTTMVIKDAAGRRVLFRQIAGALARRVVYYLKEQQPVKQGEEMGFIKFGSRVDVFLPLGTDIKVKLGDKTRGGESVLAEFKA